MAYKSVLFFNDKKENTSEQRRYIQMVTDIVSLDEMPAAFEALRTPSHQCKVLTKF